MGKLQYIHRKIEGVKLAQVVAKDLLKRIPPGLSSKTARRDPQVELDVSSKAINDEALTVICEALVKSILDGEATTRLEEFRLRDNQLTAKSLPSLATVIEAASATLQDIDLGINEISVSNEADVRAWERFLASFERCSALRRLDLGHNPLGVKAFEILARVYAREEYVKISIEAEAPDRGGGGGVTSALEQLTIKDKGRNKSRDSRSAANSVACDATLQGLHSIPYIIIDDCAIDDECALHLSHVIEAHPLVAELISQVPPARPGDHVRQLEAYDAVEGCSGIVWLPNEKLNDPGTKVLQLAEHARVRGGDELDDGYDDDVVVSPMPMPKTPSDAPTPFTPLAARARRTSVSTTHSTPHPGPLRLLKANPLRTARSRIQGNVLRDDGPSRNGLWQGSLRMLGIARPLLMPPKEDIAVEPVDEHQGTPVEPARPATPTQVEHSAPFIEDMGTYSSSPSLHDTMWPRLPAKAPSELTGNTVSRPTVFKLNTDKSGRYVLEAEAPQTPVKPENLGIDTDASSSLSASSPRSPPRLPDLCYRTSLPFGLSEEVWGRIFAYAADVEEVLSENQRIRIAEYASQRKTLKQEIDNLGKPRHAQIWRALEGMGCLAYE